MYNHDGPAQNEITRIFKYKVGVSFISTCVGSAVGDGKSLWRFFPY